MTSHILARMRRVLRTISTSMAMQLPILVPWFLSWFERSGHQSCAKLLLFTSSRWKIMTRRKSNNRKICKPNDLGRNFHPPSGPHTFHVNGWPRRVLRTIWNSVCIPRCMVREVVRQSLRNGKFAFLNSEIPFVELWIFFRGFRIFLKNSIFGIFLKFRTFSKI